MGSHRSQMKQAARRTGCSVEEWLQKRRSGFNWCIDCRRWLPALLFAIDRSRYSGLQQYCKACAKVRGLACRYGIHKCEAKLLVADPICAICGRSGGKHEVDHDHKTGKVRGILCSRCNNGLGQFLDNITLLKKAITYLEKHDG